MGNISQLINFILGQRLINGSSNGIENVGLWIFDLVKVWLSGIIQLSN